MQLNLAADRDRIAKLDVILMSLGDSLPSLKKERRLLQARLDAYVYPVLTLPNEVVSHIFLKALPRYPKAPPLSGPFSPTSLGQICREWRAIALSTPMLWRAISFIAPDKFWGPDKSQLDLAFQRNLPLLRLWLERSGACPLSIQLTGETRLLDALIPHIHRVEHLKLASPNVQDLQSTIEHSFPILRCLELSRRYNLSDHPTFLRAPRLNYLHLWGFHDSQLSFPWTQITTLLLDILETRDAAAILNNTVNLVHCILDLLPDDKPAEVSYTIRPLEQLKGISITKITAPLLRWLTLPALHKVVLAHGGSVVDREFLDDLLGCITRSNCCPQVLHILDEPSASDSPITIVDCETRFPSIPVIVLHDEIYLFKKAQ
ncbi:hypothetical protein B0H13DRAFT_2325323 [Mycena leptocephala]|nr:hypothetical protein B0H13DRAFT_2325323 [Mycena leptocephala]